METTSRYSPPIAVLVAERRLNPLGPGTPNESMRPRLQALTVASAFAPQAVRDRDMALACLAGLWLYHDYLDESHRISQDIDTPTGSYWHGIMHRREPDYGNAAYWFRRVGTHPIFGPLALAAKDLAPTGSKVPSPWDPFWFIDYCEACAAGREQDEEFAQLLQEKEWELLFHYCYLHAIGETA